MSSLAAKADTTLDQCGRDSGSATTSGVHLPQPWELSTIRWERTLQRTLAFRRTQIVRSTQSSQATAIWAEARSFKFPPESRVRAIFSRPITANCPMTHSTPLLDVPTLPPTDLKS